MAYTVRAPDEKLRIVFEGIRAENISELCRREGICPKDYYRYRDKVVEECDSKLWVEKIVDKSRKRDTLSKKQNSKQGGHPNDRDINTDK